MPRWHTRPSVAGRVHVARGGVDALGGEREAHTPVQHAVSCLRCATSSHEASVMYMHDGLHASARRCVGSICDCLDPALCLLHPAECKAELHAHVAIALQRGNADIQVDNVERARTAAVPHVHARRSTATRTNVTAPSMEGTQPQ